MTTRVIKKQGQKPQMRPMPVPSLPSFTLNINPGEGWLCKKDPFPFDAVFRHETDGRLVVVSWAVFGDGKRWLHVSVSHPERIPTHEEMTEVKEKFVGPDRKAIQVFPEASKHVNLHATCLHLYSCLDTDPLPEFSGVINGVRSI